MTLDEYQQAAARTMNSAHGKYNAANYALGLVSEGGELAEHIKKHAFHGKPLNLEEVVSEAGDCAWYLAALLAELGISLEEVAAANVEKLRARHPQGFDPAYHRQAS